MYAHDLSNVSALEFVIEIDPSKIKAVIIGGSTTEERYKPHKLTIIGNLNSLLKERNYDFEIINADYGRYKEHLQFLSQFVQNKKKNINFIKLNCKNFNIIKSKFDFAVMIVSLYQFKNNLRKVIRNLKKISKKKIIIIEEILPPNEAVSLKNIKKKIRDYLCSSNFYEKNNGLFSLLEFKILMEKNKFKLNKKFINNNILVGVFEIKSK